MPSVSDTVFFWLFPNIVRKPLLLAVNGQPAVDDVLKKLSGTLDKLKDALKEIEEEPQASDPKIPSPVARLE